jgi:hypothetical protein
MNREIGLISRAEQGLSPAAVTFVEYFGQRVQCPRAKVFSL